MRENSSLDVLCERLREFVPKNSMILISKTDMSIERLRRDIILHSRQICLHLWYSSSRHDSMVRSRSREHFRSLFHCPNQSTFPGVSQLSQNMAFLISYLTKFPAVFAQVVNRCATQSRFDALVQMTIPSVFAFFSSAEQLTKALHFYNEICRIAEPGVCVRVLEPFFNSAATVRFLENALDHFFRGFLLDLVVRPERSILVSVHSINLLQCLTDSIPLLPPQHLSLLQTARNCKFSDDTITEIVFTRFCGPAAVKWLKASARDDCLKFLQKVLGCVAAQRSALRQFYEALVNGVSRCHPPKLFKMFGHCCLLYFLCVKDIFALIRVLADQNEMPVGLSLRDFPDVDQKYPRHWFWCQVFARVLPKAKQRRNVIFQSLSVSDEVPHTKLSANAESLIQLASTFERFLDHQYKCERLKMWDDVLETQVNQLMMLHIEYLKGDTMISFSPTIHQVMAVYSIDRDLVARSTKQILELSDDWDRLAAKYRDQREVKRIADGHKAASTWIWMGIRLIRCHGKTQLYKVVTTLLKSFVQFQTIALELELGASLIRNIIGQLPADVILVPFVLLNATVTQEPHFMSQSERLAWSAFESCMLFMLQDNPTLLERVVAIGAQIARDYAK
jgi:hypothetical protein